MPDRPACEVPDCEKPRHSNGQGGLYRWCAGHRSRLREHGDLRADVPLRVPNPGCSVEDCENPHKARGYCRLHYRRLVRTGSPFGHVARPSGGDDVGYAAAHWRVRSQRGKASAHVCTCGQAATEWAYDHTDPDERRSLEGLAFSLKVEHYTPMCTPCHRAFDQNHEREAS